MNNMIDYFFATTQRRNTLLDPLLDSGVTIGKDAGALDAMDFRDNVYRFECESCDTFERHRLLLPYNTIFGSKAAKIVEGL
jgi:hypothetical protein